MTPSQLDALGYIPVAGGIQIGMMKIVLRKKGDKQGKRYMTWNNDGEHFVEPVLLDDYQKSLIKEKIQ
jgi:hypothetical protein